MLDLSVTNEFSGNPARVLQRTRVSYPRLPSAWILRRRIDQLLAMAAEVPLTIVSAPAGSGKTTALAQFAQHGGWPTAWLRLHPTDTQATFLAYLAAALGPLLTGTLAEPPADLNTFMALVSQSLADETILVLDDYQRIEYVPEIVQQIELLFELLPPRLHLIIATRSLADDNLSAIAHARGELHLISQADLAFTLAEAQELFQHSGLSVPADLPTQIQAVRGWPLAVRLLTDPTEVGIGSGSHGNHTIDQYLIHEVLETLEPPLRNFLLATGVLRQLDQTICELLAPYPGAWGELCRRVLFRETTADHVELYQPMFQSFLVRMLQSAGSFSSTHEQIGSHYRDHGAVRDALYHLLAANASAAAAEVLTTHAASIPPAQLLGWVERLQPDQRTDLGLQLHIADAQRRLGRFPLALEQFEQVEQQARAHIDDLTTAKSLIGQAQVYLDTVQPLAAVRLLKQALKLLPRTRTAERAMVLRMQAENWANRGRADVAMYFETAAQATERSQQPAGQVRVRPSSQLTARLLLRSGRLVEAQSALEQELGLPALAMASYEPALHREPLLLLAFIDTLLGNGARALAVARRGLLEAQRNGSELTCAIAHMRLGHAFQLVAPTDTVALSHYNQALALMQTNGVARTRAEAYLGLTLFHGKNGDMAAAEESAQIGLHLAETAGDEWSAGLIWLALGSSAVMLRESEALHWLEQAYQRFRRGKDSYGLALVALWRAVHAFYGQQHALVAEQLALVLAAVEQGGYSGLFASPTLFGPRDMAVLIPLLLYGRIPPLAKTHQGNYAQIILRHAYPAVAADELVESYHPGVTLRIQMLGGFRVWRGSHEIQSREWQREKSRQLLQVLLNFRGQWVQREQLCAWLWPESDLEAAERQFKVTLNALNVALEPRRPPRTPPFFVRRQGLAYSFAPSHGCWIDVDEFELRLAGLPQADTELALRNARAAVDLYQGDYLPELLYEPWTVEERERLLARYLAAAVDLANRLIEHNSWEAAIEQCEHVIRRDRCFEEAYQALMRAYAQSGSRSQAIRAYNRCVRALQEELAVEPLPETNTLYEHILHLQSTHQEPIHEL